MQLSTIIAAKGAEVLTIQPDAPIAQLISTLASNRIGALVVSTDGRTINGIVSERDVVQAMARGRDAFDEPVSSIMTAKVFCAPPDAHIEDLMQLMTDKRVRHIPVTDADDHLLGIVSIGDVVKSRILELEHEMQAVHEYITHGR